MKDRFKATGTSKDGLPCMDFEGIRLIFVHDRVPTHDRGRCSSKTYTNEGTASKPKWKPILDKEGNPVVKPCPWAAEKAYPTRPLASVRKVIVHHHAGPFKDTKDKQKVKGDAKYGDVDWRGVPKAILSSARFFVDWDTRGDPYGRHWPGFAYHIDIPYHDDIEDGKRVVYVTQDFEKVSYHTGGLQNQIGIGISMIGNLRSIDKPAGPPGAADDGRPSVHQRTVLPILLRLLQHREKGFSIANAHIQGHFQHGKQACPGYDFERFIMRHEDESRAAGRGFCYPVDLAGGSSAPFLGAPSKEVASFRKYVLNTHEGGSGYWPFGRRHPWHNGVHLFPAKAGAPVFAVRDGWVVAARLDGTVLRDEADYGSSTMVLIEHEDPGLFDSNDARTYYGGKRHHRFLRYFSCYVHLKPLDTSVAWVAELKKRDPKRFETLSGKKEVCRRFGHISVPVRTGDIIGHVGTHDAFASRPKDWPAKKPSVLDSACRNVLHFEMFSAENLIHYFDPDRALSRKWTVTDTDRDALANPAVANLKAVAGFKGHAAALRAMLDKIEAEDHANRDPTVLSALYDTSLLGPLSMVITQHVSEWGANWKPVADRWFKDWYLTKAEARRKKETVAHALAVVSGFQWWSQANGAVDPSDRGFPNPLRLPPRPFFYHPIRLLNWLNGLERTPDAGLSEDAWADLPSTVRTSAAAKKGDTVVLVPPASDTRRLNNGILHVDGSSHSILSVEPVSKTTTGSKGASKTVAHRLTVSPALAKKLAGGRLIRTGRYGWHWEAKFGWETGVP